MTDAVLVLGATGFIGRWVASCLSRRGARLHLAARDPAALDRVGRAWGIEGTPHRVDLAEPGALEDLLAAIRPRTVFNLAGYGVDRGERDEEVARVINTDLVERLAGALGPGQCLVHAGSAAEYGDARGDLREDTEALPATLYGRTKLEGTRRLTQLAKARGFSGVTARLFTVFGPGEHERRLLPSLLAAASGNGTVDLSKGRQERDFCYVEDVADALVRLADVGTGGETIVNVASGRLTSVKEFVIQATSVLPLDEGRLRFGAIPSRPAEMCHGPVNVERFRRLVPEFVFRSITDGVRATWDFHRRGSS